MKKVDIKWPEVMLFYQDNNENLKELMLYDWVWLHAKLKSKYISLC